MKQSEYNEIDTLLRHLAQRERAAQTRPDSAVTSAPEDFVANGAHLDIDELSSYAERALPPSARARYTRHLADCDDCRKIVAQLSMAAGPLAGEVRAEVSAVAKLTWIQKLAAGFSPRMIRYAMPALVLVVVAVVFFGWRQQRSSDDIALNQKSQPALASRSESEPTSAPVSATDRLGDTGSKPELAKSRNQKEANTQPTSAAPTPAVAAEKAGESRAEKKPAEGAVGGIAVSKAGKEDAPAADKAEAKRAYASEPPPAAPKAAAPVAVTQEQQQKDLARNNAVDDRDRGRDANVQRQGPARNDNEVASQRGPAKNQQQQQPVAKMKARETGSGTGSRAEEDEVEKRSISGRQFRRVNNAWVDNDYNSSMSIRNVTRGTEEYRALIAAEPVIGNIGRQLSGEVIVVWKARAYRIN